MMPVIQGCLLVKKLMILLTSLCVARPAKRAQISCHLWPESGNLGFDVHASIAVLKDTTWAHSVWTVRLVRRFHGSTIYCWVSTATMIGTTEVLDNFGLFRCSTCVPSVFLEFQQSNPIESTTSKRACNAKNDMSWYHSGPAHSVVKTTIMFKVND